MMVKVFVSFFFLENILFPGLAWPCSPSKVSLIHPVPTRLLWLAFLLLSGSLSQGTLAIPPPWLALYWSSLLTFMLTPWIKDPTTKNSFSLFHHLSLPECQADWTENPKKNTSKSKTLSCTDLSVQSIT
jgi:hypothetical protein